MSVAAILQQMAENAGRSRLQQGAIIGDVINRASQVPAEIMNQRDADALRARGEARLNAQDARSAAQDARQAAADQRDQAAAKAQAEYKSAVDAGLTAAIGDSGDPTQFDAKAAYAAVSQAGHPEAIRDVIARHREIVTKPVEFDPTKGLQNPDTGEVLRQPVAKPVAPTTASNELAIRALYAKRESGQPMTPDETAQIKGYEAEKGANDAPITVRTVENGKMVEKVMTRAQALAAGSFASQPPASIQVQNAPPPPAQEPSKAEIAMANYMVPTPSPRSFATPAGKAMMDRILTVNPDFDASLYSVRAPTRKAFTTGTQGQQLTAMNTAVEHLDLLQKAADALNNGSFVPGNAVYQAIKEAFGSNAPTNYDTIKNMVDKEVEAVANKGVPTVSGTAEQKALASKKADASQIKGYIDTLIPLMGSKVNALHYQYKQAMGANDPFDPLTPEAKAILTRRGFDPSKPNGGGSGAPMQQPIPGIPGAIAESSDGGKTWKRVK